MIPNAELQKLPLEHLYREMLNRYLCLRPTKTEYSEFVKNVEEAEKLCGKDKAYLRSKYIELIKSMEHSPDDKGSGSSWIDWDD